MHESENIRIVKKYQNRKLYDTKDSCYITLDDISVLIRKGEEIRVIDNKTKGDVTSIILTQILVEQEKASQSTLPITMLRDIIRRGKGSVFDFVQRYVVLGVTSAQGKIEAEKYLDHLVNRGELAKPEANAVLAEVSAENAGFQRDLDHWIGQRITKSVKDVTKITELETHIRALNDKLAALESRAPQARA